MAGDKILGPGELYVGLDLLGISSLFFLGAQMDPAKEEKLPALPKPISCRRKARPPEGSTAGLLVGKGRMPGSSAVFHLHNGVFGRERRWRVTGRPSGW